jgi:flavin reductase (DIM6/NTAB) family NADH-FMN oxidoreductase RutF
MNTNTFSKLSYGEYVVASGNREQQNAFIATTVMQVTAEPEKIVAVCHKDNFTANFVREYKVFSASVLKQNYKPTTMGTFGFRSGKDFNKFEHCNEFIFGKNTQVPIVLEDCLAWFECKLTDEIDVGTHILFVGEVLDAQITAENDEPLTYSYYHKTKKGVTAKNAPSYIKN